MFFVTLAFISAAVLSLQSATPGVIEANGNNAGRLVEIVDAEDMIGPMADYEYDLYRLGEHGFEYVPPPEMDYIEPVELDRPTLRELEVATDQINPASRETSVFLDIKQGITEYTDATDASGEYLITAPAGTYIAFAPYYKTPPTVPQWKVQYWWQKPTRVGAGFFNIPPNGTTEHIDFALESNISGISSRENPSGEIVRESGATETRDNAETRGFGIVKGTVTDKDTGLPVSGIKVKIKSVFPRLKPLWFFAVMYEIVPATKTVILEGGTATAEVTVLPNAVDAYVAFRDAVGRYYFVDAFSGANGEFYRRPRAYAVNAPITRFEGILGLFLPANSVTPGLYSVRAVLVPPGTNPADSRNWISNLAVTTFEYALVGP